MKKAKASFFKELINIDKKDLLVFSAIFSCSFDSQQKAKKAFNEILCTRFLLTSVVSQCIDTLTQYKPSTGLLLCVVVMFRRRNLRG